MRYDFSIDDADEVCHELAQICRDDHAGMYIDLKVVRASSSAIVRMRSALDEETCFGIEANRVDKL